MVRVAMTAPMTSPLQDFLKREVSEENLEFVLAVDDWLLVREAWSLLVDRVQLSEEDRGPTTDRIFSTFINTGALKEINIPYVIKQVPLVGSGGQSHTRGRR